MSYDAETGTWEQDEVGRCTHCDAELPLTAEVTYMEWEEEDYDDEGVIVGYTMRSGYYGLCEECSLYCSCGNLMSSHDKEHVGVCNDCR